MAVLVSNALSCKYIVYADITEAAKSWYDSETDIDYDLHGRPEQVVYKINEVKTSH